LLFQVHFGGSFSEDSLARGKELSRQIEAGYERRWFYAGINRLARCGVGLKSNPTYLNYHFERKGKGIMKTEEIVEAMKQALQKSGFPLTVSEECSSKGLIVEVNGRTLKGKLLVDYDSANKAVRLTLFFQGQPPGKNSEIFRTLNQINLDLPVGYFCVSPDSGEIMMKGAYFVTGNFDAEKFRLTVGALLGEGVKYYPLLKEQMTAGPTSAQGGNVK
jgi:hypothetical protein